MAAPISAFQFISYLSPLELSQKILQAPAHQKGQFIEHYRSSGNSVVQLAYDFIQNTNCHDSFFVLLRYMNNEEKIAFTTKFKNEYKNDTTTLIVRFLSTLEDNFYDDCRMELARYFFSWLSDDQIQKIKNPSYVFPILLSSYFMVESSLHDKKIITQSYASTSVPLSKLVEFSLIWCHQPQQYIALAQMFFNTLDRYKYTGLVLDLIQKECSGLIYFFVLLDLEQMKEILFDSSSHELVAKTLQKKDDFTNEELTYFHQTMKSNGVFKYIFDTFLITHYSFHDCETFTLAELKNHLPFPELKGTRAYHLAIQKIPFLLIMSACHYKHVKAWLTKLSLYFLPIQLKTLVLFTTNPEQSNLVQVLSRYATGVLLKSMLLEIPREYTENTFVKVEAQFTSKIDNIASELDNLEQSKEHDDIIFKISKQLGTLKKIQESPKFKPFWDFESERSTLSLLRSRIDSLQQKLESKLSEITQPQKEVCFDPLRIPSRVLNQMRLDTTDLVIFGLKSMEDLKALGISEKIENLERFSREILDTLPYMTTFEFDRYLWEESTEKLMIFAAYLDPNLNYPLENPYIDLMNYLSQPGIISCWQTLNTHQLTSLSDLSALCLYESSDELFNLGDLVAKFYPRSSAAQTLHRI